MSLVVNAKPLYRTPSRSFTISFHGCFLVASPCIYKLNNLSQQKKNQNWLKKDLKMVRLLSFLKVFSTTTLLFLFFQNGKLIISGFNPLNSSIIISLIHSSCSCNVGSGRELILRSSKGVDHFAITAASHPFHVYIYKFNQFSWFSINYSFISLEVLHKLNALGWIRNLGRWWSWITKMQAQTPIQNLDLFLFQKLRHLKSKL